MEFLMKKLAFRRSLNIRIIFTLAFGVLFVQSAYCAPASIDQWYTGSLLSPSGALNKAGSFAWEPYLSYGIPFYRFDAKGKILPNSGSKIVSNFSLYKIAVTDTVSIQATPTLSYISSGNPRARKDVRINDFPVDVVWRFFTPPNRSTKPSLNLFLGASVPSGNYTNLKSGSDATGVGTVTLRLALVAQGTWNIREIGNFRWRAWASARMPVGHAHISGISAFDTSNAHRAKAGPYGQFGVATEFALSQRWVVALDVCRDWQDGSRIFAGNNTSYVSAASSDWVMAPGIEYSWSPRFGIILGISVPIAGHSVSTGIAPQIAFNSVF